MKASLMWSLVLALFAAPASATTLSFTGQPASVMVGDSFTLDVQVTEAIDLYGFQFDVGFDPSILRVLHVQEGSFLGTQGATTFAPGSIDNVLGAVSFTGSTLLGPVRGANGNGTLLRLSFQALGTGPSDLNVGNTLMLDSTLADIEAVALPGSITVTAVPEPASVVLIALGLAGVGVGVQLRRRVGTARLRA